MGSSRQAESKHPLPPRRARDGESDENRKEKVENPVRWSQLLGGSQLEGSALSSTRDRWAGGESGFYPSSIRKLEDG